MALPLEAIILEFRFAYEDYVVAPTDCHPTRHTSHRCRWSAIRVGMDSRKRRTDRATK